MSVTVVQIASSALLIVGLLATLNLIRLFVSDWREHHRESRERSAPACVSGMTARRRRTRRTKARNAIAAGIAVPALSATAAFSQENAPSPIVSTAPDAQSAQPPVSEEPVPMPPAEPSRSELSLQLNLDYTTAYFYRGIVQEDSGLIVQPAAKLTISLLENDDFKLDTFVGAWNSVHGQKTGAQTRGDFTEYWYEADIYAGLTLSSGPVAFTSSYTVLTSPSDAFETVQELGFSVSLDDAQWLGRFALKPYATLAIETGAGASDGADSDTGIYLELGIAPGCSFDMGQTPVAISFPVSMCPSLDNYYQNAAGDDETFGFAQAGVKASILSPSATATAHGHSTRAFRACTWATTPPTTTAGSTSRSS